MITSDLQPSIQDAVVFIDKYTTSGLSEIDQICKANNINVNCAIYNFSLHDSRPYREIIKYIAAQDKPPAVIIDSNTCLYPQCIMSSTVLGTLEEMKLAEIYIYAQALDDQGSKLKQLYLIKKPTFDVLTNATWQLKAVELMCEEKEKRIRSNRGK